MNRSGVALLTVSGHTVDDLYQGAVPALLPQPARIARNQASRDGRDDWPAFAKLTAVIIARAVLFFGLTSFLALDVTRQLGGSAALGETTLALFLGCGAAGTLLGGHLADRFGRLRVLRIGYALAIPSLLGLVSVDRPWVFGFIVLTAITVYLPFSVQVTLAQDLLPNRVGTASGVSLGLAITAGGLLAPLFGALADATSLRVTLVVLVVLVVLIALPVIALALSTTLREPRGAAASGDGAVSGSARPGATRAG